MKDLEDLIQLINSYPADIKAEVLMADLIQEGYAASDFLMIFNSSFKRVYSKDILNAEKYPVSNTRDVLGVHLSRDGFYDLLPEGLFHASPDAALTSGKGMASDSKREYRIEAETRKFFLPFENEFFYQRVQLELQERSILQKLNDNSMDDFFLDFWKLDRALPRELTIKLFAILPLVKEIVGDFELTASCLGFILDEKVTHSVFYKTVTHTETANKLIDAGCGLGKASLGMDLITGSNWPESIKVIRFTIGPLTKTGITPYLENGVIARFINSFCNYFVPIEIDVDFMVMHSEEFQDFVLGCEAQPAFMGYSIRL